MLNPILIDLPLPIITERLLLRPIMPGDGHILFNAVDQSRDSLRQWLFWVDNVKNWQDSEITARTFYADFILRRSLNFTIFYNDQLIGMCSLHNIDWCNSTSEVGYWCCKKLQNKGIITEAIQALVKYSFYILKINKLIILCNKANFASIKVAEKLGFIIDKTINSAEYYIGYSKIKCNNSESQQYIL